MNSENKSLLESRGLFSFFNSGWMTHNWYEMRKMTELGHYIYKARSVSYNIISIGCLPFDLLRILKLDSIQILCCKVWCVNWHHSCTSNKIASRQILLAGSNWPTWFSFLLPLAFNSNYKIIFTDAIVWVLLKFLFFWILIHDFWEKGATVVHGSGILKTTEIKIVPLSFLSFIFSENKAHSTSKLHINMLHYTCCMCL